MRKKASRAPVYIALVVTLAMVGVVTWVFVDRMNAAPAAVPQPERPPNSEKK